MQCIEVMPDLLQVAFDAVGHLSAAGYIAVFLCTLCLPILGMQAENMHPQLHLSCVHFFDHIYPLINAANCAHTLCTISCVMRKLSRLQILF